MKNRIGRLEAKLEEIRTNWQLGMWRKFIAELEEIQSQVENVEDVRRLKRVTNGAEELWWLQHQSDYASYLRKVADRERRNRIAELAREQGWSEIYPLAAEEGVPPPSQVDRIAKV